MASPLRFLRLLLLALLSCSLSACQTAGYYKQAVGGHIKLMLARQPIEEVLLDDDTSPELREKLQILLDARQFAVRSLSLPDNDSYSTFVRTGKQAVTWNVVAAEEFSLTPKTWCFPVAGCVSYKGFFDRLDADAYAESLSAENFDVTVGGASAYSTLGWFDDPVLDTMLRGSDIRFVSVLFHELAHQVLYVKDDSNFNEAFATFVEQHGTRQWLEHRGESDRIDAYEEGLLRSRDFVELLRHTRENLLDLYSETLDAEAMRQRKTVTFESMRADYSALKQRWGGYSGYDGWFRREVNNARLLAVSTYRQYVPAFAAMFVEAQEDLPDFYELARRVGELPHEQRKERLEEYVRAMEATESARLLQ
ncbi:MAG: aminopeptidase [Granulosicoccus sp.]